MGRGVLDRPPSRTTTPNMRSEFASSSRRMCLVRRFIHEAAELALVGHLDLEEPRLALRIRVYQRRLARELGVGLEHLTANRRVDIRGGLDRFHDGGGF